MESEVNNKQQLLITLAVLIIIAAIAGGLVAAKDKEQNIATQATTAQPVASTPRDTKAASQTGSYKDGTYTATGSYISPGGREDITVTISLQGGVVAGTSAQSGAHDPEAREFQGQFILGYKSKVVGKNIDEISLSHVSGSSLTSQGFNNALSQIKSQAKT